MGDVPSFLGEKLSAVMEIGVGGSRVSCDLDVSNRSSLGDSK